MDEHSDLTCKDVMPKWMRVQVLKWPQPAYYYHYGYVLI